MSNMYTFFNFLEYISFINYETQKPLNCYFAAYAPYWIGEKSRSSGMKESWFNKIDDSVQKPVTKISFKKIHNEKMSVFAVLFRLDSLLKYID